MILRIAILLIVLSTQTHSQTETPTEPAENPSIRPVWIGNEYVTRVEFLRIFNHIEWVFSGDTEQSDNFCELDGIIPAAYHVSQAVNDVFPESIKFHTSAIDMQWLQNGIHSLCVENDSIVLNQLRYRIHRQIEILNNIEENGVSNDTTDYEAMAAHILSRPEYQLNENRNLIRSLLDSVRDWLADLLKRLFSSEPDPRVSKREPSDFSSLAEILTYIVYGIGMILLCWIAVWALRRWKQHEARQTGAPTIVGIIEPGESVEPDDHYTRALALSHSMQYRLAIRHLFIAMILYLDQENVLSYRREWTNHEFLRAYTELRMKSDHRNGMDRFVTLFDHVWYGIMPAQKADFEHALAYYQSCRSDWEGKNQ